MRPGRLAGRNKMVDEVKTVYVAHTNSDLTEGRGYDIPFAVCELETTAKRLAHKKYVQGSNGPVTAVNLVKINERWYMPTFAVEIVKPTPEDIALQKQLDVKREIFIKAKAAGLSDEDLRILCNP